MTYHDIFRRCQVYSINLVFNWNFLHPILGIKTGILVPAPRYFYWLMCNYSIELIASVISQYSNNICQLIKRHKSFNLSWIQIRLFFIKCSTLRIIDFGFKRILKFFLHPKTYFCRRSSVFSQNVSCLHLEI